jgi:purine-binding chemotaxis protein CheW
VTGIHVLVRVGTEAYALPVESVLEVAEPGAITPVPGASASVLGVRNLRGQVLPVFNLAAVLGVQADRTQPRLLVAEDNGRRAGFTIDEVRDVGTLPEPTDTSDSTLLAGASLTAEGLVGVIDVPALFDALERNRRG